MDPILLILIALTSGAKTADEILRIIRPYLNADAVPVHLQYLQFVQLHITELTAESFFPDLPSQAIRKRDDGCFELTTEGHVWLREHKALEFVVAHMTKLVWNGLPRGESIPAPRS